MKYIVLANTGNKATIDDEDYDRVNAFGKWYENDAGYAVKKTRLHGKNLSIRMHTFINDTPKGLHTDHINGDRLDNRRSNLRSVSAAINAWNKDYRMRKHHRYDLPRNISYDKSRNKFIATKTIRRRFDTLDEAKAFVAESERLDYERQ